MLSFTKFRELSVAFCQDVSLLSYSKDTKEWVPVDGQCKSIQLLKQPDAKKYRISNGSKVVWRLPFSSHIPFLYSLFLFFFPFFACVFPKECITMRQVKYERSSEIEIL